VLKLSPVVNTWPRVVVLGSRGFVGRRTIEELQSAPGGPDEVLGIGSHEIDLTDPSSVEALKQRLREGDAIVFVSALTPDRGKDIRTMMRNLAMAEHVAAAVSAVKPSHVVYVSSDAVYDDRAELVSETTACDPQSFHGMMHIVRERMLKSVLAGVPYAILRPSLLYGADDTHNGYGPNRFFRTALKEGKIALFGAGEEQRDHVSVDDVARLIHAALSSRAEGVLNIATGQAWSFGDVARQIATRAGREVEIEEKPRGGPITHRHFDPTGTYRTFPEFKYTLLPDGLDVMGARLGSGR
jgi:nucleoside-diphosphate-sugar epimerase